MDIKGDGVGSDKTVDEKQFSHGERTCRGFLWPVQHDISYNKTASSRDGQQEIVCSEFVF